MRSTGNILANLKGHSDEVKSVQFSPDGKKIVTVSYITAKIWDAATGNLLADLNGHSGVINTAEFSSDSKRIVTASVDNTSKIWMEKQGN